MVPTEGKKSLNIDEALWREMKAVSGEKAIPMQTLFGESWALWKEKHLGAKLKMPLTVEVHDDDERELAEGLLYVHRKTPEQLALLMDQFKRAGKRRKNRRPG